MKSSERKVDLQDGLHEVFHQLVTVDLQKDSYLFVDEFNPAIHSFAVGALEQRPLHSKSKHAKSPLRRVETLTGYLVGYTVSRPDVSEHDHIFITPSFPSNYGDKDRILYVGGIEIPLRHIDSCRRLS